MQPLSLVIVKNAFLDPAQLDSLYVQFHRGHSGTLLLWIQALDQVHGFDPGTGARL